MEQITDTVTIQQYARLKDAHKNLAKANPKLIFDCIEKLADKTNDVLYLDDLEVHTIDRVGDSEHNHVNEKEVVSGDATAWFAVIGAGEEIRKFEIEYEIFAGSQSSTDDFIYNPIEVTIDFKN